MPQGNDQIQIASAGEAGAAPASDEHVSTHAVQGHAERHYEMGEIPNPALLFANGVVVAVVMIAFAIAATRKMAAIPRRASQNIGEFIVEAVMNLTKEVIGPQGVKYVPLVGTLFVFIYLGNIIGLIPGFHSPTSNLSTTLVLGLIVFFYVQFVGIRSQGFVGYIKHFMGPMPLLAPLIAPIELVSEVVKPFTLAMRLFGNIFGEDTVIVVLAALSVSFLPALPVVPAQFVILVLALLTTFVQALVFTLLTCIYISLMSHHESVPGEQGAHGAESQTAAQN